MNLKYILWNLNCMTGVNFVYILTILSLHYSEQKNVNIISLLQYGTGSVSTVLPILAYFITVHALSSSFL